MAIGATEIRELLVTPNDPRIYELSPDDAQATLDEIARLLDANELQLNVPGLERRQLQRTSVKVVKEYRKLPTSFLLKGVTRDQSTSDSEGSFAVLNSGEFSGAKVGLKVLRVKAELSDEDKKARVWMFQRECLVWKDLRHEHVLELHGIVDDATNSNEVCMVIPWMENGNLRQYFQSVQKQTLLSGPELIQTVDTWLYQTALGLAYLHSEGIVHGDLHTGNLLVDENCCVRIADFGLSVLADASAYHTASENGGGTRRWIAPELHDADEFDRASRRPTRQSDVFSFGFTCTELYSDDVPFAELPAQQVIRRIVQGARPTRPTLINGGPMSDHLWTLTGLCWSHEPEDRPSMEAVSELLTRVMVTHVSAALQFVEVPPLSVSEPEGGLERTATMSDSSSILSNERLSPTLPPSPPATVVVTPQETPNSESKSRTKPNKKKSVVGSFFGSVSAPRIPTQITSSLSGIQSRFPSQLLPREGGNVLKSARAIVTRSNSTATPQKSSPIGPPSPLTDLQSLLPPLPLPQIDASAMQNGGKKMLKILLSAIPANSLSIPAASLTVLKSFLLSKASKAAALSSSAGVSTITSMIHKSALTNVLPAPLASGATGAARALDTLFSAASKLNTPVEIVETPSLDLHEDIRGISIEHAQKCLDDAWTYLKAHQEEYPRSELLFFAEQLAMVHRILPAAMILRGLLPTLDPRKRIWKGKEVFVRPVSYATTNTTPQMAEQRALAFYRGLLLWGLVDDDSDRIFDFLGVESAFGLNKLTRGFTVIHFSDPRMPLTNGFVHRLLKPDEYVTRYANKWISQISQGISYLHLEGVVFGDLRAESIFLDIATLDAQIGRFECACVDTEKTVDEDTDLVFKNDNNQHLLPPERLNPEKFGLISTRPRKYGDVYSLGLLAVHIYTTSPPWGQVDQAAQGELLQRIVEGDRPSIPADMSDSVSSLTQKCWGNEPTQRPSASEVATAWEEIVG